MPFNPAAFILYLHSLRGEVYTVCISQSRTYVAYWEHVLHHAGSQSSLWYDEHSTHDVYPHICLWYYTETHNSLLIQEWERISWETNWMGPLHWAPQLDSAHLLQPPSPPNPTHTHTHTLLFLCSSLLIRFSASVAGVKRNYHADDGRQRGKKRAERGKKREELCVFEEDDGVDRVHVHNHKLHR